MGLLPVDRGITFELEQWQRSADLDPRYKMPIPVQPVDSEHENVEAIAEHLGKPAVETSGGDLLYSTIDNDKSLLRRAVAIREQLDHELVQQAAALEAVPEDAGMRWSILRTALLETEKESWARLKHCGLKVNPGWLNDITRSMLRNRPVEIEIAQTRRPHIDRTADGHYALAYDDILKGQAPGVAFAAMLQRIQEGFDYTRPVVTVDDMLFSTGHFTVNALHRKNTLRTAYLSLRENGAIAASDHPGRDFIFVPHTRNAARVDEMVERLGRTEAGMIVPYGDGKLYFRPEGHVYNSTARQHASPTGDSLFREGVLLQTEDGTPTAIARSAAGYLDPVNAKFTHLRLRDTHLWDQIGREMELPKEHQAVSILLQSLGIAYPDRDHTIYYDHTRMSPARTVFALTTLLRNEVGKVITSLGELDDVKKVMIPEDYFNHNYNSEGGTWPEDIQGVHVIGGELPLHYEPGEVTSAAIIGYGPFSYPGLAIAPFMQPGAVINISDLLPDNIAFARKWFSGDAGPQERVYRHFGDLFRQGGKSGRFYQDCEQKLQTAGSLRIAALEDLPSDSAQVIVESFVSCSNNIEKYGFYESIRQKARVLTWTPKSMMIAVHIVGSGGWNNSGDDEGIKIAAANLSLSDIEDGYTSAGLRIVKCVPLHSDSAFREDYKGMVVIFAKPDTIDRYA